MPEKGLEPLRHAGPLLLRQLCLPIPPLRLAVALDHQMRKERFELSRPKALVFEASLFTRYKHFRKLDAEGGSRTRNELLLSGPSSLRVCHFRHSSKLSRASRQPALLQCRRWDSNPHRLVPETSASAKLGYIGS